jgi:hypothetical protein
MGTPPVACHRRKGSPNFLQVSNLEQSTKNGYSNFNPDLFLNVLFYLYTLRVTRLTRFVKISPVLAGGKAWGSASDVRSDSDHSA